MSTNLTKVMLASALLAAPIGAAVVAQPMAAPAAQSGKVLPVDTIITVTPVEEITSIKMKEGDIKTLQVAADVVEGGTVMIPRGSKVKATVTWRTGKGIGGKSAKFELTFNSVSVNGKDYALKGTHRQEGRGNTVGALLGSMFISGKSAVMTSGQIVNAFTAEPIPAA
ncbi:hypothetical protein ACNI3Q_00450 [Sphingomonas sp. FW199]|uniref:hypothetical protein n=1 Tax=Sphingomonas sp. FW199 TaxID=3400217 RepID=UPI003CEB03A4